MRGASDFGALVLSEKLQIYAYTYSIFENHSLIRRCLKRNVQLPVQSYKVPHNIITVGVKNNCARNQSADL